MSSHYSVFTRSYTTFVRQQKTRSIILWKRVFLITNFSFLKITSSFWCLIQTAVFTLSSGWFKCLIRMEWSPNVWLLSPPALCIFCGWVQCVVAKFNWAQNQMCYSPRAPYCVQKGNITQHLQSISLPKKPVVLKSCCISSGTTIMSSRPKKMSGFLQWLDFSKHRSERVWISFKILASLEANYPLHKTSNETCLALAIET